MTLVEFERTDDDEVRIFKMLANNAEGLHQLRNALVGDYTSNESNDKTIVGNVELVPHICADAVAHTVGVESLVGVDTVTAALLEDDRFLRIAKPFGQRHLAKRFNYANNFVRESTRGFLSLL